MLVECLHQVFPLVLGEDVAEPQRAVSHQLTTSMWTRGHVVLHRDHQMGVSPPHILDQTTLLVRQVRLQCNGLAAPHTDNKGGFSCSQGSEVERAGYPVI